MGLFYFYVLKNVEFCQMNAHVQNYMCIPLTDLELFMCYADVDNWQVMFNVSGIRAGLFSVWFVE